MLRRSGPLPRPSPPLPLAKILLGRYEENAFRRLVNESGIDRKTLETMLQWIPVLPGEGVSFTPWTDIRRVDGLIKRLRDDAKDIKSVNESPFVVPAAVAQSLRKAKTRAAFIGAPTDRPTATRRETQLAPLRQDLPKQLGEYADMLVGLRAYHRRVYPRRVSLKAHLLRNLILLVGGSKRVKTRWNDLATLLNAAFDAAGGSPVYTGEWLRTSYSRIMHRLRSNSR